MEHYGSQMEMLNENLMNDHNNPVTVKKLFAAGMFSGECLH